MATKKDVRFTLTPKRLEVLESLRNGSYQTYTAIIDSALSLMANQMCHMESPDMIKEPETTETTMSLTDWF